MNAKPIGDLAASVLASTSWHAIAAMVAQAGDELATQFPIRVGVDNCYVLIDFGDLTKASVPEVLEKANFAVDYLKQLGYHRIVVAGGSMPAFVNEAVDEPDHVGTIHRIEMLVWKAMQRARNDPGIIYGDYGIRNPAAMDGIISKHNNGKIRYTIANQFFILRGRSKQLERLGLQQKALSRLLASSGHYMGAAFSWGDRTVTVAADGDFITHLSQLDVGMLPLQMP